MNEAVTKRFLLYFRLMLLVWILIVMTRRASCR